MAAFPHNFTKAPRFGARVYTTEMGGVEVRYVKRQTFCYVCIVTTVFLWNIGRSSAYAYSHYESDKTSTPGPNLQNRDPSTPQTHTQYKTPKTQKTAITNKDSPLPLENPRKKTIVKGLLPPNPAPQANKKNKRKEKHTNNRK